MQYIYVSCVAYFQLIYLKLNVENVTHTHTAHRNKFDRVRAYSERKKTKVLAMVEIVSKQQK